MKRLLLVLAGCAQAIDPEPLGDYTRWPDEGGQLITVRGNAPGHSDSVRLIYVDPIAADPTHTLAGGYLPGARIVKEIYADDDGVIGALRYVAIMRRTGGTTDGGWLFSETPEPNGAEHTAAFCWARCHVAAPYLGAWYDYRLPSP